MHPSLLPRWRGAAPVERAIQAGDERTGVSIMGVIEELDAGPVYLAGEEPIGPEDDYGTLAPRLAGLAGELLVRALDERPEPRPQDEEGVTYAEKISSEERRLDPSRPAGELARTVRALTPTSAHGWSWTARSALACARRGPWTSGPVRRGAGRARLAPAARHRRGRPRAARGAAPGQAPDARRRLPAWP